jgi:hypothetical protein
MSIMQKILKVWRVILLLYLYSDVIFALIKKLRLVLVHLINTKLKHENFLMNHVVILYILRRAIVMAMAGREPSWNPGPSLSRSQSLLNMLSGCGTASVGNQDGTLCRSHAAIPTSSEEEGLELLGTAITSEDPDPIAAHGEIDTRLLDYDSDTSKDDEAVSTLDSTAATAMDMDQTAHPVTPPEMDTTYVQCHAARISSHKDLLISVSQDETFGKTVSVQSASIGSLEDNGNLSGTFLGSRMMRGNETVNQSISASIDPAKLICISCETEHNIVGKDPIVVMLSDQNFVPCLNNASRGCISVV